MSSANFFLIKVSDPNKAIMSFWENGLLVKDCCRHYNMMNYLRISIPPNKNDVDKLLLILSRMAAEFATGYNRNRLNDIKRESEKYIFVSSGY